MKKRGKYGIAAVCVVGILVGGFFLLDNTDLVPTENIPVIGGLFSNEEALPTEAPPRYDPNAPTAPEIAYPLPPNGAGAGQYGAGGEVPLIIEIVQDSIYIGGIIFTLDELEAFVQEHTQASDIWELRDAHQAANATFVAVEEMLNRLEIVFFEG
ncbi:MAG: hypothetical protein FWC16_02220 [Defluviitaleaceae bacterium]|nr:hypothetical protein [Defluviitaleaceae bacterium]MCL2273715.1 hypothetical protein [Defluviitaleaceae bacterium]